MGCRAYGNHTVQWGSLKKVNNKYSVRRLARSLLPIADAIPDHLWEGLPMSEKLSLNDESYLCLLCLKNSTERIAKLYMTYIQLRTSSGQSSPILLAMLGMLCAKTQRLQRHLSEKWPVYMTDKKWHDPDEQMMRLRGLSAESQEALEQICATEMRMLQLVGMMINRS